MSFLAMNQVETSVQTNLPMPKQQEVYYWEVKMFEKSPDTVVSVGVSTKPYPNTRMPGKIESASCFCVSSTPLSEDVHSFVLLITQKGQRGNKGGQWGGERGDLWERAGRQEWWGDRSG